MKETELKKSKNVGAGLDQPEKENASMKNVRAGFQPCPQKNNGITLIALIITIIVMLILVMVSIQVLFNTGLFDAAGKAAQKWNAEQEKESNMQLTIGNKVYGSVEDYINGGKPIDEQELKDKLAQETGNSAIDEEGNIVDISLWRYGILSEEEKTCEIYGTWDDYGADIIAYKGEFTDDGKLEENIPMFIKIGDSIYKMTSIGDYAFSECSSLTSIEIPDSVTSIGFKAFKECSSLTSIEIPDSVTSIEIYAFSGCSSLASIEIPDSVTSIGNSAFYGCSSLTSIEIPDSVTSIIGYAFSGCSSLTSIEIPSSVTSIGGSAFSGCSSLTSIIVDKNNAKYDSRNNCNAIIETDTNELIVGCKNTVIPSSVTGIGKYAFSGCSSLTSIEIPSSVTSIGSSTFRGCSNLTSIEIPDSVTSIGDSAFSGCSNLTSIEIPDSVTSIGGAAFIDCSSLTSIGIPDSVTSIGSNAFKGVPVICYLGGAGGRPWGATSIHEHEIIITKEATCLEIGEGYYECEEFKNIKYDTIAKLPHEVNENGRCTLCENEIEEYEWTNTTNGTYSFVQNGTKWISNNKEKNSSTATSTWTVTLPKSTIYVVEYGVSSESGYDKLTIKIDGETVVDGISGVSSGEYSAELEEGEHTIEAIYSKDNSQNKNDDIGWVILRYIQVVK